MEFCNNKCANIKMDFNTGIERCYSSWIWKFYIPMQLPYLVAGLNLNTLPNLIKTTIQEERRQEKLT